MYTHRDRKLAFFIKNIHLNNTVQEKICRSILQACFFFFYELDHQVDIINYYNKWQTIRFIGVYKFLESAHHLMKNPVYRTSYNKNNNKKFSVSVLSHTNSKNFFQFLNKNNITRYVYFLYVKHICHVTTKIVSVKQHMDVMCY